MCVLVSAGVRFTSERGRLALTSACISHAGATGICQPALTKQCWEAEGETREGEKYKRMWECVRVRKSQTSQIALEELWFMDASEKYSQRAANFGYGLLTWVPAWQWLRRLLKAKRIKNRNVYLFEEPGLIHIKSNGMKTDLLLIMGIECWVWRRASDRNIILERLRNCT